MTDLEGYIRELPIDDPRVISDKMHRHVLVFRHGSLGADSNYALAVAARATSSFPGAFPPLRFDDFRGSFTPPPDLGTMVENQFAIHGMNGDDPVLSSFVDGGVLDHAPFDHAVAAIRRRAAVLPVDRRLLYMEPDPMTDAPAAATSDADVPGWLKTILASVSSVPAGPPILDSLNDLAERNLLARRIGLHHCAAFFKRSDRDNDYLWGRLDAAERLGQVLTGLEPAT